MTQAVHYQRSQFLSPYKVIVLMVTAIYCNNLISLPSSRRNTLQELLKYVGNLDSKTINVPLSTFLLDLYDSLATENPSTKTIASARQVVCCVIDLIESLESVDHLHTFMLNISKYVFRPSSKDSQQDELKTELVSNGTVLDPTVTVADIRLLSSFNIFGSYVNNCKMAFDVLEFDSMVSLWESYVSYRHNGLKHDKIQALMKQHTGDLPSLRHTFFVAGTRLKGGSSKGSYALLSHPCMVEQRERTSQQLEMTSANDMEALLNYHIRLFEANGVTPSEKSREFLTKLVNGSKSNLASFHYIEYLIALKSGNFESSFELLHRYFDYMMSSRNMTFYHYALMNLANLQATYGNELETVRSIEEAISVARENKDFDCLNYLLSWLYNYLKIHPHLKKFFHVTDDQLLLFSKANSAHSSPVLQSVAYQLDASQGLAEGAPMTRILAEVVKSGYLGLIGNDFSILCRQSQVQSAVWARIGVVPLASVYIHVAYDLLVRSNQMAEQVGSEEAGGLIIRQARLSFEEGKIDEAFQFIDEISLIDSAEREELRKISLPHKRIMEIYLGLRMGRISWCRLKIDELGKLKNCDSSIKLETVYLKAECELIIGNNATALQILGSAIERICKEEHDIFYRVKFMLKYAMILGEETPGKAVSLVLKCISLAHRCQSLPLLLSALLGFSRLLLGMEELEDADMILSSIRPHVLEVNLAEQVSELYFLLGTAAVKAHLRLNSDKPSDAESSNAKDAEEYLVEASSLLRRHQYYFRLKECLDVLIRLCKSTNNHSLLSEAESMKDVNARIIAKEAAYGSV